MAPFHASAPGACAAGPGLRPRASTPTRFQPPCFGRIRPKCPRTTSHARWRLVRYHCPRVLTLKISTIRKRILLWDPWATLSSVKLRDIPAIFLMTLVPSC